MSTLATPAFSDADQEGVGNKVRNAKINSRLDLGGLISSVFNMSALTSVDTRIRAARLMAN